jgi:uncharacterized membrane protein
MLDRFLKLIVTLTLLLFLIQAVIGVLARVFEAAMRGLLGYLGILGGFLGHAVVATAVLFFAIGLVVRGVRFVANRDPRAARERAARDRAVRRRVRRPADGVPPVEGRAEVLDDSDPAIGEEERG